MEKVQEGAALFTDDELLDLHGELNMFFFYGNPDPEEEDIDEKWPKNPQGLIDAFVRPTLDDWVDDPDDAAYLEILKKASTVEGARIVLDRLDPTSFSEIGWEKRCQKKIAQ